MNKPQNKAPQRVDEPPDETRRYAADLMGHSFWSGVTFVVILLIACGIELVGRGIVYLRIFDADSALAWISHSAAIALAAVDFVFFLAVNIKKAWVYWKES